MSFFKSCLLQTNFADCKNDFLILIGRSLLCHDLIEQDRKVKVQEPAEDWVLVMKKGQTKTRLKKAKPLGWILY